MIKKITEEEREEFAACGFQESRSPWWGGSLESSRRLVSIDHDSEEARFLEEWVGENESRAKSLAILILREALHMKEELVGEIVGIGRRTVNDRVKRSVSRVFRLMSRRYEERAPRYERLSEEQRLEEAALQFGELCHMTDEQVSLEARVRELHASMLDDADTFSDHVLLAIVNQTRAEIRRRLDGIREAERLFDTPEEEVLSVRIDGRAKEIEKYRKILSGMEAAQFQDEARYRELREEGRKVNDNQL